MVVIINKLIANNIFLYQAYLKVVFYEYMILIHLLPENLNRLLQCYVNTHNIFCKWKLCEIYIFI